MTAMATVASDCRTVMISLPDPSQTFAPVLAATDEMAHFGGRCNGAA
jgi:hypothetical protein